MTKRNYGLTTLTEDFTALGLIPEGERVPPGQDLEEPDPGDPNKDYPSEDTDDDEQEEAVDHILDLLDENEVAEEDMYDLLDSLGQGHLIDEVRRVKEKRGAKVRAQRRERKKERRGKKSRLAREARQHRKTSQGKLAAAKHKRVTKGRSAGPGKRWQVSGVDTVSNLIEDVGRIISSIESVGGNYLCQGFAQIALAADTLADNYRDFGEGSHDEDEFIMTAESFDELATEAAEVAEAIDSGDLVDSEDLQAAFKEQLEALLGGVEIYEKIVELDEDDDDDDDEDCDECDEKSEGTEKEAEAGRKYNKSRKHRDREGKSEKDRHYSKHGTTTDKPPVPKKRYDEEDEKEVEAGRKYNRSKKHREREGKSEKDRHYSKHGTTTDKPPVSKKRYDEDFEDEDDFEGNDE